MNLSYKNHELDSQQVQPGYITLQSLKNPSVSSHSPGVIIYTLTVESPEALATTSPLLLDVTSHIREVWPPPLPRSPSPSTRTHCPSSTSQTRNMLSLQHIHFQGRETSS
jgi:hypothetical protein